jgi:hypothetical protein
LLFGARRRRSGATQWRLIHLSEPAPSDLFVGVDPGNDES